MVIFKSKKKKSEGNLKINLCSKRLYHTESIKYLGLKVFLTPTYPTAVLYGLRIVVLFSKL